MDFGELTSILGNMLAKVLILFGIADFSFRAQGRFEAFGECLKHVLVDSAHLSARDGLIRRKGNYSSISKCDCLGPFPNTLPPHLPK